MHHNIVSLTSALALLVGTAGFAGIAQAHEGDKLCNVLLDGDGEPVRESDDDVIDHSNSYECAKDEKADAGATRSLETAAEDDVSQQAAEIALAPVVDPLIVYFDISKSDLTAGSKAEVKAFAEQLRATDPKSISVVGYTDTSGSAALNQKLSNARASNVVASLVDAGISDSIIAQRAVGEDTLAVDTPDGTREANNRRVVITPEY